VSRLLVCLNKYFFLFVCSRFDANVGAGWKGLIRCGNHMQIWGEGGGLDGYCDLDMQMGDARMSRYCSNSWQIRCDIMQIMGRAM